jgi:hemoglobin
MSASPYDLLGGAPKVRELVERFYDLMDTLPAVQDVRRLHPVDLHNAREKLFLFLCGWLGGPEWYVQHYGHPRLRARHLPFSIGIRERDQWLYCMFQAMADLGIEDSLAKQLQQSFFVTANHMRNRPETDADSAH